MAKNEMILEKDLANKRLLISRSFNAPLNEVWEAWTKAEILDKWWAPKPYRAETKRLDFKEGGIWLYCMAGPDGDRQWCRADYEAIDPYKSIRSSDAFCDEEGNKTDELPQMHWFSQFSEENGQTTVSIELTFNKEEDLHKILEMGFKEGFEMGLGNLDEVLAS